MNIVGAPIVGEFLSKIIVSDMFVVIFHNTSRVFIYTVLVQSIALNVHGLADVHHVRFVGVVQLPYAISIHPAHPCHRNIPEVCQILQDDKSQTFLSTFWYHWRARGNPRNYG